MGEQESNRKKRKLRNWLLQPVLQIRLGMYSIMLAGIFSVAVFVILYHNLVDFAEIVVTLTDSESEIRELFNSYMANTKWWLVIIIVSYFLINLMISIVFTHRLVGPTVAFRSHLERLSRGDFTQRVILRKGDAFTEVADELNRLTEILVENEGRLPSQD